MTSKKKATKKLAKPKALQPTKPLSVFIGPNERQTQT
jgi:hypothetical protein